jgi:hypothetical protein
MSTAVIRSISAGLRFFFVAQGAQELLEVWKSDVLVQARKGVANMLVAGEAPGARARLPATKEFLERMWTGVNALAESANEKKKFMTVLAASIQFHFVWRVSQVAHPIHAITCAQVKIVSSNGDVVPFPWRDLRGETISSIVIHQTSSKTGVRRAVMSLVNGPEREAGLIERIVQWSKLANWTSEREMFFSVTHRSEVTRLTYT